jgi:hypothetical protein
MGLGSGIRKKPIPDPENAEEKNLGQFSKNYAIELFTLKIVTKPYYGFAIRDPEKNLFRIPDPWVKKAPDPGSGSATLFGEMVGLLP